MLRRSGNGESVKSVRRKKSLRWEEFVEKVFSREWKNAGVMDGESAALLCEQEAPLSPRDRAMRRVSWNLSNCHATVQKLLVRQVLNQVSAIVNWPVWQNRAVDSTWQSVR